MGIFVKAWHSLLLLLKKLRDHDEHAGCWDHVERALAREERWRERYLQQRELDSMS